MTTNQIAETIDMGTESHDFGLIDNKGRAMGEAVKFCTQIDTDGKTYLTAFVYALRASKPFCMNSGAYRRFEIKGEDERSAVAARDAWVAEKLESARSRAVAFTDACRLRAAHFAAA